MRKSLWVAAVLALTAAVATSVQAQPGKGFGKGSEGGAEYKKLEAQLSKLAAQVAELSAAVSKLQGKSAAGKVEGKSKEDFKKAFEEKFKGKFEGKSKEDFKKAFEEKFKGKGKTFGKGKFEGKGFGKGPGGFPGKPGDASSTEQLLKQILAEVKALRKEKGGFGGGFGKGPGGFKPGDGKKPDFKKPDFGGKGTGGFGFKFGDGKKTEEASGSTEQLLKEILKELKGLKSGDKGKGFGPPSGDFKVPIDGKKPGPGKKPSPGKDDAEVQAGEDAAVIDELIDQIVDELILAFKDED